MKRKTVVLIPARGGSKGIKFKNIVNVAGYPLIAHAILSAQIAGIKDVWVSTENITIKKTALNYGAKVLDRPEQYAQDDSSTEIVIEHFLENVKCDIVILIQPTSPMLIPEDLKKGLDKFKKGNFDSLFSGVKTNDILMWNKNMRPINYNYRERGTRQSRNDYNYIENGAFFIFTRKMFKIQNCRFGGRIGCSEMPYWRSFQIDSPKDLLHVRKLMAGMER